jgi:hypothetical protein
MLFGLSEEVVIGARSVRLRHFLAVNVTPFEYVGILSVCDSMSLKIHFCF